MSVLDQFRLTNRRALVTGGARGLGRVMAEALAEAGAEVAITSRSLESARAAATEISDLTKRRTIGLTVDVTSATDISRLADEVGATLGPVDILVNNAGVNIRGPIETLSEADWDAVLDTNVKGPFLLSRALGPRMAARGWGRIVNLGSILSVIGLPGRAPYGASKAAVANLTRVLALEWATQGVTVNAICPGPFGTEMNRQLLNDPEKHAAFVSKIPVGRWGELDEIKGAIVFLASAASSFVTGSLLFVDGGWTAQ
jgi:NAD(P)-dependent dehydrogenase (short-subunit alcohol dehydrogenase family)